jgi:hypothetical protein
VIPAPTSKEEELKQRGRKRFRVTIKTIIKIHSRSRVGHGQTMAARSGHGLMTSRSYYYLAE